MELRIIISLVSDTGMRLSEAIGLAVDDLRIKNEEIPYVIVQNHPWRRLKTKGSERKIPLVGASLWAAKALQGSSSRFAFPCYVKDGHCYTNSASAALNKWLRPRVPMNCSMHSFRHSIRDRLRAVGCPSEVIDQIGGWSSISVGQKYGEGFSISHLMNWIKKIV
jgi:integrase